MTFSRASNSCAVPNRCRRSVFDEPEVDFLLATLASEYVFSIDSSLVRQSSFDGTLAMFDIVVCLVRDMEEEKRNLKGLLAMICCIVTLRLHR